MAITKQSVIKRIFEFFSRTLDQHDAAAVKAANELIATWKAMPADVVIAEAESVFGFSCIGVDGQAY